MNKLKEIKFLNLINYDFLLMHSKPKISLKINTLRKIRMYIKNQNSLIFVKFYGF